MVRVVTPDELAARYPASLLGVHRAPGTDLCTGPVNSAEQHAATTASTDPPELRVGLCGDAACGWPSLSRGSTAQTLGRCRVHPLSLPTSRPSR
jgi:hypothetical protein